MRAGLGALVVASGTTIVVPGRADAPSDHEAAVTAFREARRLIDAGDCRSALLHLETSLRHAATCDEDAGALVCATAAECSQGICQEIPCRGVSPPLKVCLPAGATAPSCPD